MFILKGLTVGVLVLLLLVVPMSSSGAEEIAVPSSLQVALFKKLFDFDNTLKDKEELNLLIVYKGKTAPQIADELVQEFKNLEISAKVLEVGDLNDQIEKASIIYVLAGVDMDSVRKFCIEKSVLSISGIPKFSEKGEVSIAIGEYEGKPKITLNMSLVTEEGHEFSADILKLAKVVSLYQIYAE